MLAGSPMRQARAGPPRPAPRPQDHQQREQAEAAARTGPADGLAAAEAAEGQHHHDQAAHDAGDRDRRPGVDPRQVPVARLAPDPGRLRLRCGLLGRGQGRRRGCRDRLLEAHRVGGGHGVGLRDRRGVRERGRAPARVSGSAPGRARASGTGTARGRARARERARASGTGTARVRAPARASAPASGRARPGARSARVPRAARVPGAARGPAAARVAGAGSARRAPPPRPARLRARPSSSSSCGRTARGARGWAPARRGLVRQP